MATRQALVATAERVVAAWPGDAESWRMHATANWYTEDWSTASKSFAKAARLFGDEGNEVGKAAMLEYTELCREHAEAEAKAAAEAEAARMAVLEAAANAAMEALLAEEEQEVVVAAAKSGTRKVEKGTRGRGKKK
jgi:cytochrome c-type biogenesis protein CcmH/NrfG